MTLAVAKLEESCVSTWLLMLPHPDQSTVPGLTAASVHPSLVLYRKKTQSFKTLKSFQEKEVTDSPYYLSHIMQGEKHKLYNTAIKKQLLGISLMNYSLNTCEHKGK